MKEPVLLDNAERDFRSTRIATYTTNDNSARANRPVVPVAQRVINTFDKIITPYELRLHGRPRVKVFTAIETVFSKMALRDIYSTITSNSELFRDRSSCAIDSRDRNSRNTNRIIARIGHNVVFALLELAAARAVTVIDNDPGLHSCSPIGISAVSIRRTAYKTNPCPIGKIHSRTTNDSKVEINFALITTDTNNRSSSGSPIRVARIVDLKISTLYEAPRVCNFWFNRLACIKLHGTVKCKIEALR